MKVFFMNLKLSEASVEKIKSILTERAKPQSPDHKIDRSLRSMLETLKKNYKIKIFK